MAGPILLLDNVSKKILSLVHAASGVVVYPSAIGRIRSAPGGLTNDSAALLVGTHGATDAWNSTDNLAIIGGLDETAASTTLHPALVDPTGRLLVDARDRRVIVAPGSQPVVSTTPAYTAKDAIGGLLDFSAVGRTGVLTGSIEGVTIVDKGQQMAQMDVVLFEATISAPTDNAIFAPSDADLLKTIGLIPIVTGDWKDFSTNSMASVRVQHPIVLTGTHLFAVLVSRGTPTYTSTGDIFIRLHIRQD